MRRQRPRSTGMGNTTGHSKVWPSVGLATQDLTSGSCGCLIIVLSYRLPQTMARRNKKGEKAITSIFMSESGSPLKTSHLSICVPNPSNPVSSWLGHCPVFGSFFLQFNSHAVTAVISDPGSEPLVGGWQCRLHCRSNWAHGPRNDTEPASGVQTDHTNYWIMRILFLLLHVLVCNLTVSLRRISFILLCKYSYVALLPVCISWE